MVPRFCNLMAKNNLLSKNHGGLSSSIVLWLPGDDRGHWRTWPARKQRTFRCYLCWGSRMSNQQAPWLHLHAPSWTSSSRLVQLYLLFLVLRKMLKFTVIAILQFGFNNIHSIQFTWQNWNFETVNKLKHTKKFKSNKTWYTLEIPTVPYKWGQRNSNQEH